MLKPLTNQIIFQEPVPHPGWYGVLNATENSRACIQPIPVQTTEDCLVLNVYSPVVSKMFILFFSVFVLYIQKNIMSTHISFLVSYKI